jgi:hypothetical protein
MLLPYIGQPKTAAPEIALAQYTLPLKSVIVTAATTN